MRLYTNRLKIISFYILPLNKSWTANTTISSNDQVWDLDMTNDPINVPWKKAFGSRGRRSDEKKLCICPPVVHLIDHGINNADSTQFPLTSLFSSSVYGNGVPQYRPKVQLAESDHSYPCTMQQSTVTRDLNKSSGRGEMTNEL